MFAHIVLAFIVIYLLAVLIKKKQEVESHRKILPGPPSFPIIGSLLSLIPYAGKNEEFSRDMTRKYGPIFGFQFGTQYCAFTQDHNLIKHVLTSEEWIDRANDHPMWYERSFNKPLGFLIGSGEEWKEIRRFTIRSLRLFGFGSENMESSMDLEISELLGHMEKTCPMNLTVGGRIVPMQKFFQIASLNILWNMLASFRFSYDDEKLKMMVKLADDTSKGFKLGLTPMVAFPFLRFIPELTERDLLLRYHRDIQSVIREIMIERRTNAETFTKEPEDLMEVYLQEIENRKTQKTDQKNFFTDEQLIMVGTDLFITGVDSTSTALEFGILYMILFPDVQRKVQEEIDEFIGRERLPRIVDKQKMTYTEATTLEILRYASNLPFTMRSASKDHEINGYYIPKGTFMGLDMKSMHYSEKLWEDPHIFRPERFLDEKLSIVNAEKVMPFGAGKRICMGEVLARGAFFKFFTTILQNYTLDKSPEHPDPTAEPIFGFNQFPQEFFALFKKRT